MISARAAYEIEITGDDDVDDALRWMIDNAQDEAWKIIHTPARYGRGATITVDNPSDAFLVHLKIRWLHAP